MAIGQRAPIPCTNIRRYKRPPAERYLSHDEMALLGRMLRAHESRFPQHVAIVRLIALTGARKSEIMTLQWHFYREGVDGKRHLFLRDSKTGAKTIYLCDAARDILNALPRHGVWVFPAKRRDGSISCINSFWKDLRADTAIADVRLHDLRHSYASIALRQKCTVRVIGCLLGHVDPATTLKYTHLDDGQMQKAASDVSAKLAGAMQGCQNIGDWPCAAE